MVTRNTQTNHQIRVNTFMKVIAEEFPGIQVVAEYMAQQDVAKTYAAIMSVAQKNPDLAGMFSPEGHSGRAAAQAATELGGKIKVICCDMNASILEMIQKGQMIGAIQPNAYMQGYLSFMILYLAKNQMVDPLNGAAATGRFAHEPSLCGQRPRPDHRRYRPVLLHERLAQEARVQAVRGLVIPFSKETLT